MSDLLEELDTYLRSDDSTADCLTLSDLDGFLTGLACAPKSVANWFDVVFGAGASVPSHIKQLVERRLKDIETLRSTQPEDWIGARGSWRR